MRQLDHEEAGHEPRPRILDLPAASWSQRREGEGNTMALSYIHLGQRLELAFAGGVIGHSSTPSTSLLDTFFTLNTAQILAFVLCLPILSRRAGLFWGASGWQVS